MVSPKQLEEFACPMRAGRLLCRKIIVIERDRRDTCGDGNRRSAYGNNGGERRLARSGFLDGCGVADALAGHRDGDGKRVARERARDGIGWAWEVAKLVLLKDFGDFLGTAVELRLGGDVDAGSSLKGVDQRRVVHGWVGGGDGAGLSGDQIRAGAEARVGAGAGCT